MKKGLFLSFEGIDGCGKSTQIAHFKTILEEKKLPYISLREPGGCDISEKIRSILLDKKKLPPLRRSGGSAFCGSARSAYRRSYSSRA